MGACFNMNMPSYQHGNSNCVSPAYQNSFHYCAYICPAGPSTGTMLTTQSRIVIQNFFGYSWFWIMFLTSSHHSKWLRDLAKSCSTLSAEDHGISKILMYSCWQECSISFIFSKYIWMYLQRYCRFYTVSTILILSSVIICNTMNTSQGHYANIITVWRGLIINVSWIMDSRVHVSHLLHVCLCKINDV